MQLIEVVALVLVIGLLVVLVAVLASRQRRQSAPPRQNDVLPSLRLRATRDDVYATPEVIELPRTGRLRIGQHPPFMDRHVGAVEFRQLAHVDVRGNASAVRDLSRHVACVWRDARSGECFIQLGWPGPGEPIRPRGQTRLTRLGRTHDATSQPFRLAHGDVLRLTSGIEYVFQEVEALRDRTTPEQRKIEALDLDSAPSMARVVPLRGATHDPPG